MQTELSDQELVTYSRQIAFDDIDYAGQLKLRNARAAIVGMGGLGSLIAMKLAAMGIGHLRLIDRDVVARSDLHRQLLYDADQVGLPKVAAALNNLGRLNPDVELEPIPESLNSFNASRLLGGVDIVLDGLDGPEGRYLLNRTCQKLGTPWIFGAAIQANGNVTTIVPGKTICLECFLSGLKDEDLPKCAVVGVHPSVLGIVASLQVYEAVSLLLGRKPELMNKLLYIDLKDMEFNKIIFDPQQDCPVCGQNPQEEPEPLADKLFDETCAKDGRRTFFYTPSDNLDLEMEGILGRLQKEGYTALQQSPQGITVAKDDDYLLSILQSGIIIIQVSPGVEIDPKQPAREFCIALLAWVRGEGPVPDLL